MLDRALIMCYSVVAIIRGSSRGVITAWQLSVRYYMAVSQDTCYCLAYLTAPNKSTLSVMAKSKRASSGKRRRLFPLLVSHSLFLHLYLQVRNEQQTNKLHKAQSFFRI